MTTPQQPGQQHTATADTDRPLSSHLPTQLPRVPGSPAISFASTAANPLSAYNLPLPPPPRPGHAVLTKADLEASQAAYTDLVASAKTYRQALAALGTAASAFGSALEACARLKEARAPTLASLNNEGGGGGARAGASVGGGPPSMSASFTAHAASLPACTADHLLAASGLQHLIANHQQILGETVYRSFEVPLLHELDKWRRDVEDEQASYEAAARAQGREIRRLEKEGLKMHRQHRRRDVAGFRNHLVELTHKLDGLTTLHADHARALLSDCQDTSVRVLDASCSLVRAEVDIFESLARKGWTGGGLEDLLDRGVDLFASEDDGSSAAFMGGHGHLGSAAGLLGPGGGGGSSGDAAGSGGGGSKLFSILPPKSILADAASEATRPGHHRADSLLVEPEEHFQSLTGALTHTRSAGGGGGDAESFVSELNRPRGARPFSPQPVKVDPEEVMGGGSLRGGEASAAGPASSAAEEPAKEAEKTQDEAEGEGEGEDERNDPQPLSSSPVSIEEPTPRPPSNKVFKILHNPSLDGSDDRSDDEGDPWRNARSPRLEQDEDHDGEGGLLSRHR